MRTLTSTRSAAAELLADRVPLFAGAWLAIVALITLIETLQSYLHPGFTAAVVVLQATIVGVAVAGRAAARAEALVLAVCGCLAVSNAATFASFGGSAEILGVVLFALTASAASFFVWGWRAQAALNAITGAVWVFALPYLSVFSSALELVGVTAIGWVITLGLAESMARTFRLGVDLRERERAAVDALQASYDAYRDLAENARDFLWTADLAGRFTYVNESSRPARPAIGASSSRASS